MTKKNTMQPLMTGLVQVVKYCVMELVVSHVNSLVLLYMRILFKLKN